MRKILTNKYVFSLLLLTILILTSGSFYRATLAADFRLNAYGRSLVIELSNGKYIELTARNDVIDNNVSLTLQPFPVESTEEHQISGFDFAMFFPEYKEVVTFGQSKRTLVLTRTAANQVRVKLDTEIIYTDTTNFNYVTQLDYSGSWNIAIQEKQISLTDGDCRILISRPAGYAFRGFAAGKSLRVSQPYQPQQQFNLTLDIYCD